MGNVSGHIKGCRSTEVIDRQLAVFAAVDQDMSDRIAKAIGRSPVKPLAVKKANEAARFQPNVGKARL